MRLGKTFILCKTTQKSISENLRNKFDNMTRKLNFLRKSKMSKHDISSPVCISPDMFKPLVIQLDTTVQKTTVEREYQKPNQKE